MAALRSSEVEKHAIANTTRLSPYLQELTRVTYEEMEVPQQLSGPVQGMLLQVLVWGPAPDGSWRSARSRASALR